MKSVICVFSFVLAFSACSSSRIGMRGHTRTIPVQFINGDAYLLTIKSDDSTYGYQQHNPVKVGGLTKGPSNERRFLNGLRGPGGERVSYSRAGSCCPFKTPNGLMNNTGLLDKYLITWENSTDTLVIYINMYDEGDLKVPVGFTARTN